MTEITFDGTDIIKHPDIDINSYHEWRERQDRKLNGILERENSKSRSDLVKTWMGSVPDEYRGACVSGLSRYDPKAGGLMKRSLDRSIKEDHARNVIIYSTSDSGLKTWALYAWLEDLVRGGVITDPEGEIKIITETELSDVVLPYNINLDINTKQRRFKEIFTPERKILAVTDCGALNDLRKNRRIDLWNKILSNIKGTRVSFACTMDQPIGDDATPVMQDEMLAMSKIIRRSDRIDVNGEVDGR